MSEENPVMHKNRIMRDNSTEENSEEECTTADVRVRFVSRCIFVLFSLCGRAAELSFYAAKVHVQKH